MASTSSPADDTVPTPACETPAQVQEALRAHDYIADRGLATAMSLALTLAVPLLVEGEPGVGKTELARALATATGRRLLRLQCYEGIDAASALYEWDYARQLLHIKATAEGETPDDTTVFTERFLLERPLLAALRAGDGCVLLIDEVDRADEAFEAFLLEFLSDFQITIPELGTVRALSSPVVVLTSNRTRELHDALRRRCLFHWIDYPTPEQERTIVGLRVPGLDPRLVHEVTEVVNRLRELDLDKVPGVSETILWARALAALGLTRLDEESVTATVGALLKDQDDVERVLAMRVALVDEPDR